MAVYTQVGESDIDAFLEAYAFGVRRTLAGIKKGVSNSNYRLTTTQGTAILTVYEERTPRDDLPFFLELMAYLGRRQIPCPLPMPARDGRLFREMCGKPAALVSFLEGRQPERITPELCGEIGLWLARIHVAGEGFGAVRANGMGLPAWRALIARAGDKADAVSPGFTALLAAELDFLAKNWPRDLPAGVIHADLFPDNIFIDENDHVAALIDFYFACTDFFAYDLAIAMNAWCFEHDVAFNITKARALLRGYERVRPLTPEERWRLPTLARGAALRIIATRLDDWLNQTPDALVKPLNPLDYLTRLTFHQQITSLTAYGFDP
jgi:homoserine kinase type II